MKPEVIAAVGFAAVATVAAVGHHGFRQSVRATFPSAGGPSSAAPVPRSDCPAGTLPDQGVCIPAPAPAAEHVRSSNNATKIPRRPDRDTHWEHYRLPVEGAPSVTEIATVAAPATGADVPSAHDGVMVAASVGATVSAIALDGQDGPAHVVYSGPLVGTTVVTDHVVRAADRRHEYLVVMGNLASAPPLTAHQDVTAGAPLGAAGATPIYFETRLVLPGTDVWSLAPNQLLEDASTLSIDARNVLGD